MIVLYPSGVTWCHRKKRPSCSCLGLPWNLNFMAFSRPLYSNVAGTQRSRVGSVLWGALVTPSNYSKNFLRLWWVGEEQNKVLNAVESSESRRKLSRAADWCGLNPWVYQPSQNPIRRYVKATESLAQKLIGNDAIRLSYMTVSEPATSGLKHCEAQETRKNEAFTLLHVAPCSCFTAKEQCSMAKMYVCLPCNPYFHF